MYLSFIMVIFIPTALIMINSLIAKKSYIDREKPSPFECGFDLKSFSRAPFSIRFFLIAIIFLIFDVEITLLVPLPVILLTFNPLTIYFVSSIFTIILVGGLYHEWNEGSLLWK